MHDCGCNLTITGGHETSVARFDLPLKVPDVLHLAAAQGDGLRLITADRQLARNAEALDVAFEMISP